MKEITASLNDHRQSPRKVRLVANAIRGKSIAVAKHKLTLITKRATHPLNKLVNSAIANAKNMGIDLADLMVKSITVNGGKILYRSMPAAHGSAHPIRKRTSHITVVLGERQKSEVRNPKSKTKTSKLKAKS